MLYHIHSTGGFGISLPHSSSFFKLGLAFVPLGRLGSSSNTTEDGA